MMMKQRMKMKKNEQNLNKAMHIKILDKMHSMKNKTKDQQDL